LFSKVFSCGLHGINGFIIDVEVDIADGLPNFEKVGYLISTKNAYRIRLSEICKLFQNLRLLFYRI